MNNLYSNLQEFSIPMPITQEARQIAQRFARQQPTPQKAEQVYHNTLAVCAVNNYLRILGIETNLTAADCWNPLVRFATDVADLEIIGLGRLECRLIRGTLQTNQFCFIPPEVQSDRIGYIVAQFNEEQQEVTLLGFAKQVFNEQLPLNKLQPVDELLDHLANLRLMSPIILSQWLENIFTSGWQALEDVYSTIKPPELAFRSSHNSISRVKILQVGNEATEVALVIAITDNNTSEIELTLTIYPTNNQVYLPTNLELALLDEQDQKIMEAQTKNDNQSIQFNFSGFRGDSFSVRLTLAEDSISERFII